MLPYNNSYLRKLSTDKISRNLFNPLDRKGLDTIILLLPILILVTVLFLIVFSVFAELAKSGFTSPSKRFFNAVLVSITSATLASSTALLAALPYAYMLSRKLRGLDRLLETLGTFFLGFPPIGVGMAILVFLSGNPIGKWIEGYIGVLFSFKGLVVAQFFVVFPIVLKLLREVIDMVPREYEDILSLYGVPRYVIFARVIVPLARNGIIASWIVGWLRSLGEFGASVMVAGLAAGRTETLTIYLYNLMASYNIREAVFVLAFIAILVMAFSIFITHFLTRK